MIHNGMFPFKFIASQAHSILHYKNLKPFKDEAHTALFKDPDRTAL